MLKIEIYKKISQSKDQQKIEGRIDGCQKYLKLNEIQKDLEFNKMQKDFVTFL